MATNARFSVIEKDGAAGIIAEFENPRDGDPPIRLSTLSELGRAPSADRAELPLPAMGVLRRLEGEPPQISHW